MRAILALLMLAVLALSGAAPTCAHPQPAHVAMRHHHHKPAPVHEDAHAHADCIGCGTELPDPPCASPTAFVSPGVPPLVRRETMRVGTAPQLPLRPPRA